MANLNSLQPNVLSKDNQNNETENTQQNTATNNTSLTNKFGLLNNSFYSPLSSTNSSSSESFSANSLGNDLLKKAQNQFVASNQSNQNTEPRQSARSGNIGFGGTSNTARSGGGGTRTKEARSGAYVSRGGGRSYNPNDITSFFSSEEPTTNTNVEALETPYDEGAQSNSNNLLADTLSGRNQTAESQKALERQLLADKYNISSDQLTDTVLDDWERNTQAGQSSTEALYNATYNPYSQTDLLGTQTDLTPPFAGLSNPNLSYDNRSIDEITQGANLADAASQAMEDEQQEAVINEYNDLVASGASQSEISKAGFDVDFNDAVLEFFADRHMDYDADGYYLVEFQTEGSYEDWHDFVLAYPSIYFPAYDEFSEILEKCNNGIPVPMEEYDLAFDEWFNRLKGITIDDYLAASEVETPEGETAQPLDVLTLTGTSETAMMQWATYLATNYYWNSADTYPESGELDESDYSSVVGNNQAAWLMDLWGNLDQQIANKANEAREAGDEQSHWYHTRLNDQETSVLQNYLAQYYPGMDIIYLGDENTSLPAEVLNGANTEAFYDPSTKEIYSYADYADLTGSQIMPLSEAGYGNTSFEGPSSTEYNKWVYEQNYTPYQNYYEPWYELMLAQNEGNVPEDVYVYRPYGENLLSSNPLAYYQDYSNYDTTSESE